VTSARTLIRHAPTGIECFRAHWRNHQTRPHAHPEYQLTWTVSGAGRMTYRGGRARLPAGCMALFHPGEPHVLETAREEVDWSLRVLHVPAVLLERRAVPLVQPAPFLASPELLHAAQALWEDASTQPSRALSSRVKVLANQLCALPGLELEEHPASQVVRRCLEHLAAELTRSISMEELAHVALCPAAKLRKLFVAATGLPPHAWHLQRRIQHGKHLLVEGKPVAEVALATGFSDQAHFTRHFSVLVGVSPARYASSVVHEDDAV
jgi:AraC-like DNA-binding protein